MALLAVVMGIIESGRVINIGESIHRVADWARGRDPQRLPKLERRTGLTERTAAASLGQRQLNRQVVSPRPFR